jgi:hypothetical protein
LRDFAGKHQTLERRLIEEVHTRATPFKPNALDHSIDRIAKLITPFIVWIVGKCSISVPVGEFPFLYDIGGLHRRVADLKTGDPEPVDGRDQVVVAHGLSHLDLDGRGAEAVVCKDLVGKTVVSFLRRWVGGRGLLHLWVRCAVDGFAGVVSLLRSGDFDI